MNFLKKSQLIFEAVTDKPHKIHHIIYGIQASTCRQTKCGFELSSFSIDTDLKM